jgi:hypothetical protein
LCSPAAARVWEVGLPLTCTQRTRSFAVGGHEHRLRCHRIGHGACEEVIEHERNGLLTDFFDFEALARCVSDVLQHPAKFEHFRSAARGSVQRTYDLQSVCLPQQLSILLGVPRMQHFGVEAAASMGS